MSNDFYDKRGPNWDRLIREFTVDYVLLEYRQERLRPADLLDKGYVLIWENPGNSALLALEKHAAKLKQAVAELPPPTINPPRRDDSGAVVAEVTGTVSPDVRKWSHARVTGRV